MFYCDNCNKGRELKPSDDGFEHFVCPKCGDDFVIPADDPLNDDGVFEETVIEDDSDENEDFWNSDCGIDDIEDDTRVCSRDGSEFCQLHCKWHYMLTEKSDVVD